VDTYAWIEYLKGTSQGALLKKVIDQKVHKLVTMECSLAELQGFCLRDSIRFDTVHKIVQANSVVLPVLRNIWLDAAHVRYETRKKVKHFGMLDAVLVAKQRELKCKIITGDPHFKNLKDVVYLGA
jgi:predicted nucleic acid-binding protein